MSTKCYKLNRNKGETKCEQVESCYWDKKKRCQNKTRKRANETNESNTQLKLNRILRELVQIKSNLSELRRTQKKALNSLNNYSTNNNNNVIDESIPPFDNDNMNENNLNQRNKIMNVNN